MHESINSQRKAVVLPKTDRPKKKEENEKAEEKFTLFKMSFTLEKCLLVL